MDTNGNNKNSSRSIYFLDVAENGISFSKERLDYSKNELPRLTLSASSPINVARTGVRKEFNSRIVNKLEEKLIRLSSKGILRDIEICFGKNSDPLHPFNGRFDLSIKILDLFKTYTPGKLYFQTRSPLVVLALPVFKILKSSVMVTIAIESFLEEAVDRYTPDYPRAKERLKAALALRRFGIPVHIQVAPLLPYGNIRRDAYKFANLLVEHADYISLDSLSAESIGRNFMQHEIFKKLTFDRKLEYLSPNASEFLMDEIEFLDANKLVIPSFEGVSKSQLSIFAA